MVSRQKRQLVVIGGVLGLVLLLAMSAGPICLPAPVETGSGWQVETRCFLWLSPALQPETPGLALVSLPPDWHPVE